MRTHPHVQLVLLQGIPAMIAQWVSSGEADIGISGKSLENRDELLYFPCAKLERSIFVPKHHPLCRERKVTLAKIAQYPIITLDRGLEGGRIMIRAFEAAQLKPNIVLSAIDADIVKCYVELGLGVAILLSIAYEPERDRKLAVVKASHLFEPTISQIVLRSGKHLPTYMHDFIHKFSPQWHTAAISAVVRSTIHV
jgi:LysR family cys regulon transcriptional activator